MANSFVRLALLVAALTVSSTAAFAQREVRCRPEISATGSAALTETGAKEKAIVNWRRAVIARYGEFFSNYDKAKSTSVERCAKTLLGLTRCEARGQPCEASAVPAGEGPNEIACNSDDSRNCSPLVKWVQTRLNAKGARLKVDGAEGSSTQEALRKFKRANNLGDTDEITDRVIAALAA